MRPMLDTGRMAAAFCAGSFPADALQKGLDLSSARAELLRDGWRPVETFLKYEDGELERLGPVAGDLLRAGYPEIQGCMGTGSNPCIFNYQKGYDCGRLVTVGERNLKVENWSNQCPPDGAYSK